MRIVVIWFLIAYSIKKIDSSEINIGIKTEGKIELMKKPDIKNQRNRRPVRKPCTLFPYRQRKKQRREALLLFLGEA